MQFIIICVCLLNIVKIFGQCPIDLKEREELFGEVWYLLQKKKEKK